MAAASLTPLRSLSLLVIMPLQIALNGLYSSWARSEDQGIAVDRINAHFARFSADLLKDAAVAFVKYILMHSGAGRH